MARFPLSQCRIVMVETTHPGNIGAAARAMKTMGLEQLHLVRPKEYPSVAATARASGATDILENIVVHNTLAEALADVTWVFGASARQRSMPWPCVAPRQMGEMVARHPETGTVAILFGREARGLTNDELKLCNYHVAIPTNPEYGVLNVSAAIQVITYELRMALAGEHVQVPVGAPTLALPPVQWDKPPVTQQDMCYFMEHLQQVLEQSGFLDPLQPDKVMPRLQRLFMRTQMDEAELGMLRGALKALQKSMAEGKVIVD